MREENAATLVSSSDCAAISNRNRNILADAVKQIVLVIISLGFTNAFTILVRPTGSDSGVSHILKRFCVNQNCAIEPVTILIFFLYILIGTRFLLTSWIYLSTTYRENDPKKRRIFPDALGIFLTGLAIGLQSFYAEQKFLIEFFILFLTILLIDVVASVASIALNWMAVRGDGLRQEIYWVVNNVLFAIAMLILLNWHNAVFSQPNTTLLTAVVFANCFVSFGVSWHYYFRSGPSHPSD